MWLYVNGDNCTAAAEAVNVFSFAQDDPQYFYMGRAPHPDNIAVSWGKLLSQMLKMSFKCDAESMATNDQIIHRTNKWINEFQGDRDQILVIIQWADPCDNEAHDKIWAFRNELKDRNIKHLFFNGNDYFKINQNEQKDWSGSYIGPYDPALTYTQWLKDRNFDTVLPNSWHFGKTAHSAWAQNVLKYVVSNKLIT